MALNVNITNKKSDKASLLALANVEALANPEEITVICGYAGGPCWVQGYAFKYCGERGYYQCVRSDDPHNSCVNPC